MKIEITWFEKEDNMETRLIELLAKTGGLQQAISEQLVHEDERMEEETEGFKEEQDNVNKNFSAAEMEISYHRVQEIN